MIKVSVLSTDVRQLAGVSKSTGKPYSMNFQAAWFHLFDQAGNPNPYPEKTELILKTTKEGLPQFYQKGEYFLADNSFYIDRNGSLSVVPRLLALSSKTL